MTLAFYNQRVRPTLEAQPPPFSSAEEIEHFYTHAFGNEYLPRHEPEVPPESWHG
jgi:hypothetical protein